MLLIKLHCLIYINYDLAAVLHDRILENPVLVFLGGVESYAKELAYPFGAYRHCFYVRHYASQGVWERFAVDKFRRLCRGLVYRCVQNDEQPSLVH